VREHLLVPKSDLIAALDDWFAAYEAEGFDVRESSPVKDSYIRLMNMVVEDK
jgi:hypothetical protein